MAEEEDDIHDCQNCGRCGKGVKMAEEEADAFEAANMVSFVKKVIYSYNVIYSSVGTASQLSIRATPDVYLAALKNLSGKEIVDWKGELAADYSRNENGSYPYLKGRLTYKGTMKFSDKETVEMELEYSGTLMPFLVEQLLNTASCSFEKGRDLPRAGFKDILGIKNRSTTLNRLEGLDPPRMAFEYLSETSLDFKGEEVIVKRPKGSDKLVSIKYGGEEKEMIDTEVSQLESALFASYLSSNNTQNDKPRLKVNGEYVDVSDYLDGILLAEMNENVYKEMKTAKERYVSVKKRLEELDGKISELRYKLEDTKNGAPSAKESIKRIDNALFAKEKEFKQNLIYLVNYGAVIASAYSVKSSMKRAGFKNAYKRYEEEISSTISEDFLESVNEDMMKYKSEISSFLQLGGRM